MKMNVNGQGACSKTNHIETCEQRKIRVKHLQQFGSLVQHPVLLFLSFFLTFVFSVSVFPLSLAFE
jgi:hypothetical protein